MAQPASYAASQPTNAGIITDAAGVRQIPESTRPDGSTRRAIRIRPGYQPPEDVALYRNRVVENFRNRMKSAAREAGTAEAPQQAQAPPADSRTPTTASVPGATPVAAEAAVVPAAASATNKNAKRREARKKAAAEAAAKADKADKAEATDKPTTADATPARADPQTELEKKARALRKKLKQAKDLQSKRDDGEALLPEQIAKVIRISELARELAALGLDDADGEGKPT